MRLACWVVRAHDVELELFLEFYGELSKDIKHESDIIGFYFRKVTFCCMDPIERSQDQKQENMTTGSKREVTLN